MKRLVCAFTSSVKHTHVDSEMPFSHPKHSWKWTFVVMLGDDLMDITNDKAVPLTKAAHEWLRRDSRFYHRCNACNTTRKFLPMVFIAPQGEGKMDFIVLKPSLKTQHLRTHPGDLSIIGRYLSHTWDFGILENQAPGAGNENPTNRCYWYPQQNLTSDLLVNLKVLVMTLGDKFGFMRLSIEYALKHPSS